MARKKTQAGFHVGQIVRWGNDVVRIKAFPSEHMVIIVPEPLFAGTWYSKTVWIKELRP